jgi:hypothetical protein
MGDVTPSRDPWPWLDENRRAVDLQAPQSRAALARHAAFWARGPAGRPLRARSWYSGIRAGATTGRYEVTPALVRAGLARGLDELERSLEEHGVLDGDLFRCLAVPGAPPWLPAILGCRILFDEASGTHWREKLPGGWAELQTVNRRTGGAWREVLLEGTRQFVVCFGVRYPLAVLYERGSVDFLAHALGDQEMCFRLLDESAAVHEALDRLTDLWLAVAQEVEALVPRCAGGRFHPYGLWAPGGVIGFAVDAANILSPGLYREFFLPCDRRIAAAFDYCLVHTHSAAAQHYPAWVTIPNLAIQIADDPVVPIRWPALLAAAAEIQRAGRPLVFMAHSRERYGQALDALSPQGLTLTGYDSY